MLKNLKAVLDAGGSSLENVVKTTILLKDISDFGTVNSVYGKCKLIEIIYFLTSHGLDLLFSDFPETSIPPARATYAVSALPKGFIFSFHSLISCCPC